MATFEAQVEALTSLAIDNTSTPTQNELSQFLKDGVIDVTNKWLSIRPEDTSKFMKVSSEQDSNSSLDINGAKIISVVREDGTDNQWRECREISIGQQYVVTDTTSLHYASKFNPVYMVQDNGKISVFPNPGADPNSFKVYYVNNVPVDKSLSPLVYTHSDIGYFIDDKVYLVVIYASIKTLEAKLSDSAAIEEDSELVQSIVPVLQVLQNDYNSAFLPDRQIEQMRAQMAQQQG
jgi:hypothetical protein